MMLLSSITYGANSEVTSHQKAHLKKLENAALTSSDTLAKTQNDPQFALLAKGQAAFNAHHYKQAFNLWHDLAEKGHTEAQVFVGLAYKNGWGVARDPVKASMWFQMAAEGGNPSAQFFVGLHYLSSNKPEMVPIGVNWLVQAARNGESSARQLLLKAKRRQWFPVPDNFEVKTSVTQVTASNIDKVFTGSPSTAGARSRTAEQSLRQAQAQIRQSGANAR